MSQQSAQGGSPSGRRGARNDSPIGFAKESDVNDPVVAVDDFHTIERGTILERVVLINDLSVETGRTLSVKVSGQSFTSAQGGTVHMSADGFFRYTGPSGYTGDDSFDYVVTDGVTEDTGTVTVRIIPRGTDPR